MKPAIPFHVSLDEINRQLSYDPISGDLRWNINKKGPVRAEDKAGSIMVNGYRVIGINGKGYLAHRIAWFMHYGVDPVETQIDHADRNRGNNAIKNLRLATDSQNRTNTPVRAHSKLGVKGVSYRKGRNLFRARITVNSVEIHLGEFTTVEEAHAAYCHAAKRIHGEFFNAG